MNVQFTTKVCKKNGGSVVGLHAFVIWRYPPFLYT